MITISKLKCCPLLTHMYLSIPYSYILVAVSYPYTVAIVSFEQSVYVVDENNESVVVSLVLQSDHLRGRSITVDVFTTDGSATGNCDVRILQLYDYHITGNVDYEFQPIALTFTSGVVVIPLEVPIFDDDIFEGNETFSLTIDSSTLPNNVITGDVNEVVVVISDDDECKQVK